MTAGDRPLSLSRLPGRFAVCRLDADLSIPAWALHAQGELLSITRTAHELSIVAPQDLVPPDLPAERDFAAMRVNGPLDFALVGILAKLTGALAAANISTFAISTYDTDILLVKAGDAEPAINALQSIAAVD